MCGQVPECQLKCSKINNSKDDPILGHVVHVVYETSMPVVVKSEKMEDEDEDLVFIGATPGNLMSAVPINVTVKKEKEKIDNTQESQSQFESPVFGNKAPELGESSQNSNTQSELVSPVFGNKAKEGDSENEDQEMPSAQAAKRLTDTAVKGKSDNAKKRKTPGVVLPERSLRSRTSSRESQK